MDLLKIWQNKLGQKYTWCINSIAPSNFITCPLMLFLVIMIDYRWCILCAHINSVNLSATIRLSHIYYNGTVYGALYGQSHIYMSYVTWNNFKATACTKTICTNYCSQVQSTLNSGLFAKVRKKTQTENKLVWMVRYNQKNTKKQVWHELKAEIYSFLDSWSDEIKIEIFGHNDQKYVWRKKVRYSVPTKLYLLSIMVVVVSCFGAVLLEMELMHCGKWMH